MYAGGAHISQGDPPDETEGIGGISRTESKVTVLQRFSRITRITLKHNDFEGNLGTKTRYAAEVQRRVPMRRLQGR
jgi:hypothetical protein